MVKVLSVIIPTYNMESLLGECLDSLLVHKNLDKLDILVVNDGSKDKSSQIAHDYEHKYPGVFTVVDKENGNYGSCINAALPLAQGKYVKVLDADDKFNTINLDLFLDLLSNIEADLVLTDFANYDIFGNEIAKNSFDFVKGQFFNFSDIPLGVFLPMHSVTYRKSIFNNIKYRQTEGVSYTDMEWVFYPMSQVNSVYYWPKEIYHYLVGREGQTMDFSAILKRQSHAEKGIITEMNILDLFSKKDSHYAYLNYWFLFRLTSLYKENLIYHCVNYRLNNFDDNLKESHPMLWNEINLIKLPIKHTRFYCPIVMIWRLMGRKRNLMFFHPLYLLYKLMNKF